MMVACQECGIGKLVVGVNGGELLGGGGGAWWWWAWWQNDDHCSVEDDRTVVR